MLKFIFKRLLEAIPTLLVLITVSFFMMRFAPGNPFTSERALPPEVLANIEAKYGLDKPIGVQYLTYLGNLVQGDLGPSFKYKDFTVNDLVSQALPVSAKIGSAAFVLAVLLGVTFGTIAALKQNTLIDYLLMSSAMGYPSCAELTFVGKPTFHPLGVFVLPQVLIAKTVEHFCGTCLVEADHSEGMRQGKSR